MTHDYHCALRYGIWGDWEEPYLTLDPAYEAAQLKVFAKMVLNGHIYRGRKPVHWSPSSQTALAESELEYPEGHVSPSIYVALPIKQIGNGQPLQPCSPYVRTKFAPIQAQLFASIHLIFYDT